MLNTHSRSKPSLQSCIHHFQRKYSVVSIKLHKTNVESVSSRHQQEEGSISHQQKLPAFAQPIRSISSNSSMQSSAGNNYSHLNASSSASINDRIHWESCSTNPSLSDHHLGSLHSVSPFEHDSTTHRVLDDDMEDVDLLKIKHHSFLSSPANIIDLVAITSYWINLITLFCFNKQPWPVLQAFAAVRLLRLLVLTEGTTVIMNSLRSSLDMLKNVMGFFMFFWLLFSLAALLIFMNAFSRRCAIMLDGKDLKYVEPRISCSGYMISTTTFKGAYDIKTGQHAQVGGDGQYCQLGQICIQDTSNQPQFGYMSYENILFAMLNIMTVISTEDWTDLMYISQDSVSNVGAAVFYCACIYLMTFIVVPMFIAVITTSFAHARGDMRNSAFSSSSRQGRILLASGDRSQKKTGEEEWVYGTDLSTRGFFSTRSRFQRWAHRLTQQKRLFTYVGSVLVACNVITMTFYHTHLSKDSKKRLGNVCKAREKGGFLYNILTLLNRLYKQDVHLYICNGNLVSHLWMFKLEAVLE